MTRHVQCGVTSLPAHAHTLAAHGVHPLKLHAPSDARAMLACARLPGARIYAGKGAVGVIQVMTCDAALVAPLELTITHSKALAVVTTGVRYHWNCHCVARRTGEKGRVSLEGRGQRLCCALWRESD